MVHCVFHGHHINHFSKCVAVEKILWELVPQRLGHYIVKTALKGSVLLQAVQSAEYAEENFGGDSALKTFTSPVPGVKDIKIYGLQYARN